MITTVEILANSAEQAHQRAIVLMMMDTGCTFTPHAVEPTNRSDSSGRVVFRVSGELAPKKNSVLPGSNYGVR